MMTIMCDLYCVGPHLRAVERKQERGGGGESCRVHKTEQLREITHSGVCHGN